MADSTTRELFGVARGGDLIGELYPDREIAERNLDYYRNTAAPFGIAAEDLDLVSVHERTTYGKPKVITPDQPVETETPGDTETVALEDMDDAALRALTLEHSIPVDPNADHATLVAAINDSGKLDTVE